MPRMPIPGSDDGTWGDVLNDFLEVEHNPNGTLKKAADIAAKYTKPTSGIPKTDLFLLIIDLLKVEDLDVLPNMVKPMTLEKLKSFYK